MKRRIWVRRKDRVKQRYWVGRKNYGSKFMSKRELNKLISQREKEGIIVLPIYEGFIFHDPETRERKVIFEAKKKNYGMVWHTEPGQYIEHISPKEFIRRAGLSEEESRKFLGKYYDTEKKKLLPIEGLSKHIKSSKTKVYVPWHDDPSPLATGHEGRHRAYAAELAGEKLIPVAVPLPKEKREELAEEFIKETFPDSHFSYQNEWRERFRRGHPEQRMDTKTAKIFDKILLKHRLK